MEIESSRNELITEFVNFTLETNKTLSGILGEFEESGEFSQDRIMLTCPFNSNHRIPENSLEQHLEACQWKAEGYDEKDLPLSIPSVPHDNPSCIIFDEELLESVLRIAKLEDPSRNIADHKSRSSRKELDISFFGDTQRLIPRTSDRLVADFTTEERKILYEYVIANTVQVDIGKDIADLNKPQNEQTQDKRISYLEMVAQERNLKRRRAKHRGVHTNKKSDIEVMREVINQQMEMLAEHIADKELLKVEKSYVRNGHESQKGTLRDDKNYRRHDSRDHQIDLSEENRYRHKSREEVDGHRDKRRRVSPEYSRMSSRDSSEENFHRYKLERENNRHRDIERKDKYKNSTKSSRDYDRHESRHRGNSGERKHRRSRERHHSKDKNHTKHKKHESKEYGERSSRSSRDNNEGSRNRRRSRD